VPGLWHQLSINCSGLTQRKPFVPCA